MVEVLVESGGDDCREAALDGGEGTHGLHLVTHHFATTAHDALVHIADDRGRNLDLVAGLCVVGTDERVAADAETDGESLKLALAALGALQTVIRVVGEHELEHRATGVDHAHRIGADHHVGHTFGDAGGSQVTTAGDLHDTDTASTGFVVDVHALEFKVAKGGNGNTQLLCGVKNRSTFRHFNFSIVYF